MIKRLLMDDSERKYIQDVILTPISKEIDKIHLFENMSRARLMLESSINRLSYEKDRYEIKLDIYLSPDNAGWNLIISSRPKDCEEFLNLNVKIG